ncbi:hypothetical protein PUV54_04010 [Hyphococcus flavus]|uniref:Biopolymer transporter Tol n=1 Tax=Hyphococcus flavus TaxID=1866326 RepID=A0AAE9ZD62_9PROT|nr:hypothetical protein [Hyphococcus flavus]WDI32356.1 hypothetical protein PUV54_04010 [Hyphococcus flavus]
MRFLPVALIIAVVIGIAHGEPYPSPEEIIVRVEDQYPVFSPDGKWIAFESRRADGVDHIFVARRDGTDLRQLTHAPEDDETPVFSRDGKRILFARRLGEGRTAQLDIFSIDIDGENIRNLSNDARGQDDHHKFSTDGKHIVFNSSRSTPFAELSDEEYESYGWNYDIWVMDADGANQRPIIELPGWDTYPSFSPDGAQLLWRRVLEEGERNSEIFIADADGADMRNISGHPAFDGYPDFSPDGAWIVFASNRDGGVFRLYAMRPDGSYVTRLTDPAEGAADVRPAWSPDGRTIIFNRDSGGKSQIMTIDASVMLYPD